MKERLFPFLIGGLFFVLDHEFDFGLKSVAVRMMQPYYMHMVVGGSIIFLWAVWNWDFLVLRWRWNRICERRHIGIELDGTSRRPRLAWADRLPHGYRFGVGLPLGCSMQDIQKHEDAFRDGLGGQVAFGKRGKWDVVTISRNLPEEYDYEPQSKTGTHG